MLLFLFGQVLHWLPVGGMTDPLMHGALSPAGRMWDVARHTLLPALTLGIVNAAAIARFHRGALADVLASEWVRTARAKGLPARRVLLRHGVRSALAPVVTLAGLSVPALLAGSVLVESVFGWPGMGRLMHEAILARDYNVITGLGFVTGVMVAVANLAADLGVAALDPRQRA
jgi:peptide/nickel transport system permease protein